MTYARWPTGLPDDVEVVAIQYPGRGSHSGGPIRRLGILVDQLRAEILPHLDEPFVFFGHSMGALVAYELARHLRNDECAEPRRMIVSGRGAPHIPSLSPFLHHLTNAEFIEQIRRMGGTPEEILNNQELMSQFLPLLRADFEAIETWSPVPDRKLSIPIIAIGGFNDQLVPLDHLEGWQVHTDSEFEAIQLPGSHFFLNTCREQLLQRIYPYIAAPHPTWR